MMPKIDRMLKAVLDAAGRPAARWDHVVKTRAMTGSARTTADTVVTGYELKVRHAGEPIREHHWRREHCARRMPNSPPKVKMGQVALKPVESAAAKKAPVVIQVSVVV